MGHTKQDLGTNSLRGPEEQGTLDVLTNSGISQSKSRATHDTEIIFFPV